MDNEENIDDERRKDDDNDATNNNDNDNGDNNNDDNDDNELQREGNGKRWNLLKKTNFIFYKICNNFIYLFVFLFSIKTKFLKILKIEKFFFQNSSIHQFIWK